MSAKKVEGSSAPAIRRDPYEVLSGTHLDQKDPKITHSDGFSMADLRKSILIDGLSTADLQRSIYSMVDLQKSYFKRCAKKATEPESSNSVMGTDNIVAEVVKPKGRQPAKKKAPAAKKVEEEDDMLYQQLRTLNNLVALRFQLSLATASRKRGPGVGAIGVSPEKKVRQMMGRLATIVLVIRKRRAVRVLLETRRLRNHETLR